MWDQLHLCDGLFQNWQWRLHLYVDMFPRILASSPSGHTTLVLRSSFNISMNHLGVILLLVLGPELMLNAASCPSGFRCTLSCSLRAVSVVPSLLASQLEHRRSCHCTETVEHLPFSVSFESQAPVVTLLLERLQCSIRDPS